MSAHVVRNPLMPLLPLLQRAQHLDKHARPKLTSVVPSICRDHSPKHTKSIPLSRIGMYMLLIEQKSLDLCVK